MFATAQAHTCAWPYPLSVNLDVNLARPRVLQGVATGVVLAGFVADWRPVVLVAAIGLVIAFVVFAAKVRRYGRTWATEVGLLVLSAVLFALGRAGFAWFLAMLAAGVAATAAIADVWIAPTGSDEERSSSS